MQARERLTRLGYANVEVRIGDGYYGWAEHAPFDVIVVTAVAVHIPPPLLKQLKPGGAHDPAGRHAIYHAATRPGHQGRRRPHHDPPDPARRFVPLTGGHPAKMSERLPWLVCRARLRRRASQRDPADPLLRGRSLAPLRLHDDQPRAARVRRERHVRRAGASLAAATVRASVCRRISWRSAFCAVPPRWPLVRCRSKPKQLLWDPWQPLWLACCLPRARRCRSSARRNAIGAGADCLARRRAPDGFTRPTSSVQASAAC